ncbi:MAG: alpha/beta hydrolase [Desulfovibrio sp.]|nr:alpha/beta hydrolase [Desulfovibrio sp.]
MTATVIWSHGKDAQPWGAKSRRMADMARQLGVDFDIVDYQDLNDTPDAPERRVDRLLERCSRVPGPLVLAGSSMGGYVSLCAAMQVRPLGVFALAPAVYLPGYVRQEFADVSCPVEVVHGWQDEVVPAANVLRLAEILRCTLHMVPDGHRLSASVERLAFWFMMFVEGVGGQAARCEPPHGLEPFAASGQGPCSCD